jgi:hypothetical protein
LWQLANNNAEMISKAPVKRLSHFILMKLRLIKSSRIIQAVVLFGFGLIKIRIIISF